MMACAWNAIPPTAANEPNWGSFGAVGGDSG